MREGVIRFCIVKREYDTMDNETKEKMNDLQHQHELLREKVEGSMKTMKAENGEALAKNEAAIERLRTGIFIQMVGVVAAGVAVLGGFIAILQFLK